MFTLPHIAASQACMLWEPPVNPGITQQVSAAAASHAPADFSCATPDAWLQLLQAACVSARALRGVLAQQQAAAGVAGLGGGGSVAGSFVGGPGGAAALQVGVEGEARELQVSHMA